MKSSVHRRLIWRNNKCTAPKALLSFGAEVRAEAKKVRMLFQQGRYGTRLMPVSSPNVFLVNIGDHCTPSFNQPAPLFFRRRYWQSPGIIGLGKCNIAAR